MKHLKPIYESIGYLNDDDLITIENIFSILIDAGTCKVSVPRKEGITMTHGTSFAEGDILVAIDSVDVKSSDIFSSSFTQRNQFKEGMEQLRKYIDELSVINTFLNRLDFHGYSWELIYRSVGSFLIGSFIIKINGKK